MKCRRFTFFTRFFNCGVIQLKRIIEQNCTVSSRRTCKTIIVKQSSLTVEYSIIITWYCLSWNTFSVVLTFSSAVSFVWIWLILNLKSLCRKSALNSKLSVLLMSLPGGCFFRTRVLPHASDWRTRPSSSSSTGGMLRYRILCKT